MVEFIVSIGYLVWTSVSFLIMIFSIDNQIGKSIKRDYNFFRKIYNDFLPKSTCIEEKRFIAHLIKSGVLKRHKV